MVDNQALMSEAKILIHIGDSQYLQQLLSQHKLTTPAHYLQFVQKLKSHHDYDVAQQICKTGNIEILQFFRKNLSEKDQYNTTNKSTHIPAFNMDFVDENGQNCLHYSVARGHQKFVKHLLFSDRNSINVNQQTNSSKESPLFFALSKLKNDKDKIQMVKTLLEKDQVNVSLTNSDNKYAFEAYSNQFGSDQAANLIEKGDSELVSSQQRSYTYLNDFSKSDKERLIDPKVDSNIKENIIEQHIFRQGEDFDYRLELLNQLNLSRKLQDQLKNLQSQSITVNPQKYIDEGELRKILDKKLMEFVGVTLINNMREAFNKL